MTTKSLSFEKRLISGVKKKWISFLSSQFDKNYFLVCLKRIKLNYSQTVCCPPIAKIFLPLKVVSPHQIRVIILGQDPYPDCQITSGIAFDVLDYKKNLPYSLRLLMKKTSRDLAVPFLKVVKNLRLRNWLEQGVFIWNIVPTVTSGLPLSHHVLGWEKFSCELIRFILNNFSEIPVVVIGSYAKKWLEQEKVQPLNCLFLPHPAGIRYNPLLAAKFFNINFFRWIEEKLPQRSKGTIKWLNH